MSMKINQGYKGFPYPTVDCSKDKRLTVQADANEVDINRIVARVNKGLAVPFRDDQPFYGDVSDLGGLQEAIMKVQEADDLFMQMDAGIREKFDNDPVKMVDFLSDPKNLSAAQDMGLVQKRPEAPREPPKPASPEKAG